MNLFGSRRGPILAVLPALFASIAMLFAPSAAQAIGTNTGGVLLLHVVSDKRWEPDTLDVCYRGGLKQWAEARTRLAGDGVPRLVLLYAAFPPDSTPMLKATTFGLRYSPNVRIWASGGCSAGGNEFPVGGWPASGSGVSVINGQYLSGPLLPVHWFVLSAKGVGFFEVTPNPLPAFGGTFANAEVVPSIAHVSGYGRIGFDVDGVIPKPGTEVQQGACCTPDGCFVTSDLDCGKYQGTFLGAGASCEAQPCGEFALKGACCLPSGCEQQTRLECVRAGGTFLGDGVRCDSIPCPKPGGVPGGASGVQPAPAPQGSVPPEGSPR